MSIKPEFAERILSGEKRVEFRKRVFRKDVSHVVIYSTAPIGALVGLCQVEGVFVAAPDVVWRRFGHVAGIERAGFAAYYRDRQQAVAISVANVVRFEQPVALRKLGQTRPPQSFRYLGRAAWATCVKLSTHASRQAGPSLADLS